MEKHCACFSGDRLGFGREDIDRSYCRDCIATFNKIIEPNFKVILHRMHIGSNRLQKRIEIKEKIKREKAGSIVLSLLQPLIGSY